eukprot:ANDGO_02684.mRNA.1 Geranylgeranyl pyrophosphate synthase
MHTADMNRSDNILLEPYEHLARIPGKNVRSMLVDAYNEWLCVPEDKVSIIKNIIAKLHNASLLIDDIEDNSKLRRGIPAAHTIYGIPATINTANYVYFLAMSEAIALGSTALVDGFLKEMIALHQGQGEDIYWRDTHTCPTEEQYEKMVMDKTGGLFRLTVRLMLEFSKHENGGVARQDDEFYLSLASELGLYFQIMDDYLNLKSTVYAANKSFAEDLSEGKYSFPIIHCIRASPSDRRVENILKQRTQDVDLKQYVLQLIERAGSFDYTREYLCKMHEQVVSKIKTRPNPMLSKVVDSWFQMWNGVDKPLSS